MDSVIGIFQLLRAEYHTARNELPADGYFFAPAPPDQTAVLPSKGPAGGMPFRSLPKAHLRGLAKFLVEQSGRFRL